MNQSEINQLVFDTVKQLADKNYDVAKENHLLLSPLTAEIAVHTTLKVLQKLNIITEPED